MHHQFIFYELVADDDAVPCAPLRHVLARFSHSHSRTAIADAAFLPMLPAIRGDLALTQVETGSLLAATTLAMLLDRRAARPPREPGRSSPPAARGVGADAALARGAGRSRAGSSRYRRARRVRRQLRDPLGRRPGSRSREWPGRLGDRPPDRGLGGRLARRTGGGRDPGRSLRLAPDVRRRLRSSRSRSLPFRRP